MSHSSIRESQARLTNLYSATACKAAGSQWLESITEHYARLQQREGPVLNWTEPNACVADAMANLSASPLPPELTHEWIPRFTELVETILNRGQNLHHPRYIGHQVPASIPIAALFDAIGTMTNQVMAIYEMGPWATSVERAMISKIGSEIGYAEGSFAGLITNGGSLANLTALLTARNVAVQNVWRDGIGDSRRLAFVVQHDVHYCVTRSAGILGIGTDQIVRIPVDKTRKMRVEVLDETLAALKSNGRNVVAVTAGACSTPFGAFDPLIEIADVCERHGVWMHVDAAHGGAALMSDQHKHLVAGIDRADSVVWDAHKMLFMPALCAFALYKNKEHRFVAFDQDAPYLFDPSNPQIAEYDSGTQTIECTKRAAAYGLWGIWSLFGRQLFSDLVDVTFATTQILHGKLVEADDFEPMHLPECNIQVFRYLPEAIREWSQERIGEFQLELRRIVITSGNAYIVPIQIDGVGALRATVINPCTTEADIDAVLNAIRCCSEKLLAAY